MNDSLAALLRSGAKQLGVELSAKAEQQLMAYLGLLIKWNKAYNLTAVRNPEEMVSRHLLDSLSVVQQVADLPGSEWLDVGSGGGMPGIPFAIMFPERNFTLLDSNGKKTRFLTQVKLELGLDNLSVIHGRVESVQTGHVFDGISSRAFSSLADFANWTRHLGNEQTRWVAMKGIYPEDELAELPTDFVLKNSHALTVPGCQGERHVLILQRLLDMDAR